VAGVVAGVVEVVVAGSGVTVWVALARAAAFAVAGWSCCSACTAVRRAARSSLPAVVPLSWPDVVSVLTSDTNSPSTTCTAVPSCLEASARARATSESRRFSPLAWSEAFCRLLAAPHPATTTATSANAPSDQRGVL